MSRETRSAPVEVRMSAAGGRRTLISIAPPWNSLSQPMSMGNGRTFRERFTRGAFGNLAAIDCLCTFEHDNRMLLGRTPHTMRLADTAAGLRYECDLSLESTTGRDVAEHVARGDVRGSSFEFRVRGTKENPGDVWDEQDDGTWLRTIRIAELFQCGPVLSPAYVSGTDVALRSLEAARGYSGSRSFVGYGGRSSTPRLDRAKRELALIEAEAPAGSDEAARAWARKTPAQQRRRELQLLELEQLELEDADIRTRMARTHASAVRLIRNSSTPRLDRAKRMTDLADLETEMLAERYPQYPRMVARATVAAQQNASFIGWLRTGER